jgi:hypothetical protein
MKYEALSSNTSITKNKTKQNKVIPSYHPNPPEAFVNPWREQQSTTVLSY